MSLQSFSLFQSLPLSPSVSGSQRSPFSPELYGGVSWSFRHEDKQVVRLICQAISKSPIQEHAELFQNGLPVIKRHENVGDDIEGEEALEDKVSNEVQNRVESIKLMLGAIDHREISVSAYDTAWVALVQDVNGSGFPQFPSSLEWIANNQLPDGSWGDAHIFLAHDRIINTLACVIAIKSWNIHPEKCAKGMSFLKENMWKLENENAEHMPIGFEIAFPSLIEIAKSVDIVVPNESPAVQEIYKKRNIKLTRIPKDIMHTLPTTLLHSLEGMQDLEWEKLLKFQSKDGSFLFSPSSTAYALMQTKDQNCFNYLKNAVQKFNGGVPCVYPVDLFQRMWAVDRLQRLGISRYFQREIKSCIDYVYRYWTDGGICWAKNSPVYDMDDTSMGFRLLRLHGYDISADVFRNFRKGQEFFCVKGQSTQAVTGMFNLYRASQVQFPEEEILEDAKHFSSKCLREMQASNELVDKWIITKDLPGEVGYALEVPWYASLPRVEARFYIEQYGGNDDVWIGKTLYRMNYVNNNVYLELAKLDYNSCQALHRIEWDTLEMWYRDCKLDEFGMGRRDVLHAYFVAAASIFEPERSKERLAWAKTSILIKTIASHFNAGNQRRAFFHEFVKNRNINGRSNKTAKGLVGTLIGTLDHILLDTLLAHGQDSSHHLHQDWEKWLRKWEEEGDTDQGHAELLIQIINLSAGRRHLEELSNIPHYQRLLNLTNRICHQLSLHLKQKEEVGRNGSNNGMSMKVEIESDMQELVKLVVQNSSDGISSDMKHTFLTVAKTFYYSAYSSPKLINFHISKVIFERVV